MSGGSRKPAFQIPTPAPLSGFYCIVSELKYILHSHVKYEVFTAGEVHVVFFRVDNIFSCITSNSTRIIGDHL